MDYKEEIKNELERKWKRLMKFGDPEDEDEKNSVIWLCSEILHDASEVGDLEKIIMLFDQIQREFDIEIEVDMDDGSCQTPLLLASGNGYPDIVEYLILNGADVNAVSRSGDTPLIKVAQNCLMDKDDQLNIVNQLIVAGADVNFQDTYGKTPLMLATESSSPKIVSKLLLSQADIKIKDKCGNTVFDITDDVEITQFLMVYNNRIV
jgi:hypothetical protein